MRITDEYALGFTIHIFMLFWITLSQINHVDYICCVSCFRKSRSQVYNIYGNHMYCWSNTISHHRYIALSDKRQLQRVLVNPLPRTLDIDMKQNIKSSTQMCRPHWKYMSTKGKIVVKQAIHLKPVLTLINGMTYGLQINWNLQCQKYHFSNKYHNEKDPSD